MKWGQAKREKPKGKRETRTKQTKGEGKAEERESIHTKGEASN